MLYCDTLFNLHASYIQVAHPDVKYNNSFSSNVTRSPCYLTV